MTMGDLTVISYLGAKTTDFLTMNLSRSSTVLLIIIVFTTACTSSKFDFKTAYKFDRYQYHQKAEPLSIEPVASLKPILPPQNHLPPDQVIVERGIQQTVATFKEQYQKASRQERKALRKEVKQQFKQVRKDLKVAQKEHQQKDVYFNKKMYIGLVVLLAGIVVAILASGPVGALAIIVGVALIAWGFIEQA